MKRQLQLVALACMLTKKTTLAADFAAGDDDYESRIHQAKLELWLRGEFAFDYVSDTDVANFATHLEKQATTASFRHGPIREVWFPQGLQ